MAFEGGHIPIEIAAPDKASVDQFLANIVDEVPQDQSPVIACWIDTDDRINVDVYHSCGTK
jgi:hypothetical protein